MLNNAPLNCLKCALHGLGLILLGISTSGFAATPDAYLENAQVFASGKKFQAFRVPTVDAFGKVQFYNVTVDLNVLANGKINTTATAKAVVSPNTQTNKFIPGTYTDSNGSVCTVVTAVLDGGRTEAAMSCKYTGGYYLQANWITGPVPGHPFELDLKAAKIDKVLAHTNYSWGKDATSNGNWWGCIHPNDIISARQIGNVLSIGGYDLGNKQACGTNLVLKK